MFSAAHVNAAQFQLNLHCPSPDADLIALCLAVATSPEERRFATIRLRVTEVDALTAPVRWKLVTRPEHRDG